jgi:hypothetical protein
MGIFPGNWAASEIETFIHQTQRPPLGLIGSKRA